jgi:hypothetical protein
MSALSIQVPYQIFADSDGTPLENGYVWIGTTNLDPRTNPVNVYFDAALTQVAPNPLRTVNGYVYNAGSPAQLYIDGVNFSIRVEDKKSVLVYSFPSGSGISPNASGVIYTPAGTGAVATDVESKLRIDLPTVTDVGMLAANTAVQNTAAINLALASNSNKVTLVIPAGTFQLSPEINLGIYKRIVGAGRDQTILQFVVNSGTAAFLMDQYCSIEGVTIQNIGTNTTGSSACCSYTPTEGNGWANGVLKDSRVIGFGYAVTGTTASSSPFTASLARSQTFNTKLWNNIFQSCGIPIYLGVGGNAMSIKANWFNETTGNRNIVLNTCLNPTVFPDNSFQGCAAGGFDIEMTGCYSPKISGYFEPAYGIYADSCPGLDVDNCILNGFAASKSDFVVTTDASNASAGSWSLPIKSTVRNIALYGSGAGKYCVNNAADGTHVTTLTDNIASQAAAPWGVVNGLASYPMFSEITWTPTIAPGTSGSFTLSQQSGRAIQRGKEITAIFQVAYNAVTGPVGTVNIGGLPQAIANISPGGIAYSPAGVLSAWGPITTTGTYSAIGMQGIKGTTNMQLIKSSNAGSVPALLTCAELGAFGQFNGSITYEVD